MNNRRNKEREYISEKEQKKLMLEMLRYIDHICRKNNICYSLFAGSLIGAVRHEGFIPWDDDIDIILTFENFEKLKTILDNRTGRYQILKDGKGGEKIGFTKLIDTKTCLMEKGYADNSENYGVFVDIFCYYPTSETESEQLKHYNRIKFLKNAFIRHKIITDDCQFRKIIRYLCWNTISRLLGYKRIKRLFEKELLKYNSIESEFVVCNWPAYGCKKEVQLKKHTMEYMDAKFETLTVMIFKDYDKILRTTFGDYMKLPPKNERTPKHNMIVWWRDKKDDSGKEENGNEEV